MAFSSIICKTPLLAFCIMVCLLAPLSVSGSELAELESSFNDFLVTYIKEIKSGNTDYLKTIHPKLPEEQRDFFVNITLDMMKYARDNNLSPTVACRE